ncbi:MAG: hypothetical protein K2H19_06805, partial [Ruminococcus sp.]|nr:hypothetical protein [Ruminococcus sp.]
MKITLVTASFNDIVHGTFNDKKTGCGINLLKPDTASRYHRSGQMTDLGEITCEKCKSKIAKEIIKADSKEMKALLKQERIRAKKGLDDENLVELSKLEVKPTGQYIEPEPEVSESAPVSNISANTENPAYTDDLAQFAIKKPQNEPESTVESEPEDDFLNQFSIKKPQEESVTESEPESDFLAQFAIQKTNENIPDESISDDNNDDFLAQFSVSSPSKSDDYEESEKPPVIDDISSALEAIQKNSDIHTPPEYDEDDDDILSMFSLESKEKQPENISIYDYDNEIDLRNVSEFNTSELKFENTTASILDDLDAPIINSLNAPEIEDISVPVLDDFDTPEIEDISAPVLDDFDTPEIEDISAPVLDDFDTP